jgi:peptide deformylase
MIREIKVFDEPVLRKKSKKVDRIDPYILRLLDDMTDTMYDAMGIGLAAPQIGVSKRLIVVDVGEGLYKMINPKIIQEEGSEVTTEGCLSIPGKHGDVERSSKITVKAQMPDGKYTKIEAEGLFAICLQHEIDHLDGTLFTDKAVNIRDDQMDDEVENENENENEEVVEENPEETAEIKTRSGIPINLLVNESPAIFEKR